MEFGLELELEFEICFGTWNSLLELELELGSRIGTRSLEPEAWNLENGLEYGIGAWNLVLELGLKAWTWICYWSL